MSATQGAAVVVRRHLELALSVHSAAVLALLSFNKLTSVIIKVFSEIAVHGFCPVKELDEEGAKVDEELKSSEKETGLGQGAKDVSDQIDNEDMLDGAYQNPEDGQDKEEKDNKEEDTGIEMSGNFDSNLQDKKEEEEDEEDKEGELEDETGDVEGNEDLDKDKWGEEEDDKADKAGVEDSEEHRARPRSRIWRSWLLRRIRRRTARRRRRGSITRRRRRKTTRLRSLTTTRWIPTRAMTSSCQSPEAMKHLPDAMELDDKEEDNFEKAGDQEPEKMPDFENDVKDKEEEMDEEGGREKTKVDTTDQEKAEDEEKLDEAVTKDSEEEMEQEQNSAEQKEQEARAEQEHSGMDVNEEAGQEALKNQSDLEKDNKSMGEEGKNDQSQWKTQDTKSFGVKGKEDKEQEKQEAGAGSNGEEEKRAWRRRWRRPRGWI